MITLENVEPVRVWGGDGTEYLGTGRIVGETQVYYFEDANRRIYSLPDPTREPRPDFVQHMMDKHKATLCTSPNNPIIQMDDGGIYYACQVWYYDYVPGPRPLAWLRELWNALAQIWQKNEGGLEDNV